jgi:hypothetical protein
MSEPTAAPIQPGTMRAQEVSDSLTGFEVIAIEDHWRDNQENLSGMKNAVGMLAMMRKREGMTSKDAWQSAQSMTQKQIADWFAPEPDADTEQDEPGKD